MNFDLRFILYRIFVEIKVAVGKKQLATCQPLTAN